MATLSARIAALAGAVRDKINTITPRILPGGGSSGQVLSKSSGTDYAVGWTTPLKAYSVSVGNGSALTWNIDHNLGTLDVVVQARVNSDVPTERLNLIVDWYPASTNRVVVTVRSEVAPPTNGLRITVMG